MAAARRINRLRREMRNLRIDALAITNLRNIRYLSGFSGSSALALVTMEEACLVTDFRYRLQARTETRGWRLVEQKGPQEKFLGPFLGSLDMHRLGFESGSTFAFVRRLRRAARPAATRAVDGVVEKLRLVKEAGEVSILERLAGISVEAMARFGEDLRAGITEREAAFILECHLRRLGSDPPPFPVIVAAGENGALPHARPGDRIIREGDAIVVDFGASGEGYATDMTRTLCLGKPRREVAKAYRVVYDAQVAAIEAVRPGARASGVDAAARAVIRDAGMGDFFGHATGHGVGLDVHEAPGISPESKDVLLPGMVLTVEPGVYLAGRGGVRIEDTVLVTRSGRRVLTGGLSKPAELGPPG